MTFLVRLLLDAEFDLYRDIRLEALRLHPAAFGASHDEEAAQPPAFFRQRLTANAVFAGFADDALMGIAGFMPEVSAKRAHKGHLWGAYVRPAARGSGLARRLVDAVLDHAGTRVELVQLSVGADNPGAQRLYASAGFLPYGLEERSLKLDGRYVDDVLMVKRLV